MRNSVLSALVLGAAVLSGNALAQVSKTNTDYYPYGFTIKGGIFLPFDNSLSNADTIWAGLGLEYSLGRGFLRGSETFISGDWIFRSTAGDSLNFFPLAINQRFVGGPGSSMFGGNGRSFFSVGLGVAFLDPRSDSRWMFRGAVGTDLGERTFVEGVLYLSDRTRSGVNATGAQFNVGYRF